MGRRRRQKDEGHSGTPTTEKPVRAVAGRPQIGLLILLLAGVCIWVAAVYWPMLTARAYAIDDHQFFFQNKLVLNPSWESVRRFVTEVIEPSSVRGYYQPLTMISLMLDCAMGATPEDPSALRRTSLLLHVANTGLLVGLVYLLFGNVCVAAGVGLLFGLHPMTVEPTVWIAGRKTMLASFFAFACLVVYVRFTQRPHWWRYVLCALLFAAAMLSKPTTVPLVVCLLLLDYWPLRRMSWRSVIEKLPLLAVALAGGIITIVSQLSAAGAREATGGSMLKAPLVIGYNTVFYLRKMLVPVEVCGQYPVPDPLSMGNTQVAIGVIGTLVLIAALLVAWRWTRAPLTGWLFFLIAIFPTMGVIGFTFVIAADKYAYLPAVGLLLVLAALLNWLWKLGDRPAARRRVRTFIIVAIVILGGLESWGTRHHLSKWRDTETLARYLLSVTPGAYSVRYNLGLHYLDRGRVADAIREFERIAAQYPVHWRSRASLGRAFMKTGELERAAEYLQQAVDMEPDYFPARYNLGLALVRLGRPEKALPHYRCAAQLRPSDYSVHVNSGRALFTLNRFDEALAAFDVAARIKPDHVRTHVNRAAALERLGRTNEAIEAYRRALALDPDHASARGRLAALTQAP